MAISSQGTTFTFLGTVYTVTSVSVNYGGGGGGAEQRQRVSSAFLGSDPEKPEPFVEIWQPDPTGAGRLSSSGGNETKTTHAVDIEFLGASPPAYGSTGSLSIAGPITLTFGEATCRSATIRASVGDIVRGSASFAVK